MDPLSVHTAAYTALDAIAHVTVYDGDVPDKPPADTFPIPRTSPPAHQQH